MKLPKVGQIFENFKILDDLGSGGMGHVFLAEDINLRRKVALKFLGQGHEKIANTLLSRFEQEARVLASLNHPNVVNIYAIGRFANCSFLVMEYVDGANLGQLMDATEIDCEKAVHIVKQVLRGLNEAHNKGILHRDIKPENILIDNEGKVKIVDFGICKDMSEDSERITKENLILGTISYMAPEVIQMQNPSTAADIFSLGVVLYEMVVGRHPFHGSTAASRMYRICNDPIKFPRELYDKVSVGLPELIEKMTSIVLDYRYSKAVDVLADLENLSGVVLPSFRSVELESDSVYNDAQEAQDALLLGGYDMDEALRIIEMAQSLEDENDPSSEMENQVARIMSGTEDAPLETEEDETEELGFSGPLSKKSIAIAKQDFEKNKKTIVMPEFAQSKSQFDLGVFLDYFKAYPKLVLGTFLIAMAFLAFQQWDWGKETASPESISRFKKFINGISRSVASVPTAQPKPLEKGSILKIQRTKINKSTGDTLFDVTDELEVVSSSGDILFSKLKDGETQTESVLQFARNPFLPPLRKVAKGQFDIKNIIIGSSKKVLPLEEGKTFDVLFTTINKGVESQSSRFCEVKAKVEIQKTEVFKVDCTTRMGSEEIRSEMFYSPEHNLIVREIRTLHQNGFTFIETHQVTDL